MRRLIVTTAGFASLLGTASASLLLDFNSNQAGGGTAPTGSPSNIPAANHEAGFNSYWANHENFDTLGNPIAASYDVNFALTGASTVTLTPAWPNTTSLAVRQSIGRSGGQAASWLGNNQNLLRDWIGIDSRPGGASGGNGGNFDGTNPTYFTLTLAGLPAGSYDFLGYHHDVENMNSFFSAEVSVDGGDSFGSILEGRMTNSLAGGTPAENEVLANTGVNIAGGNPADLSSTMTLSFTANGADEVVLRYAPTQANGQVHRMFFGINGFELSQTSAIPEPSTGLLGLLALSFLIRRRR